MKQRTVFRKQKENPLMDAILTEDDALWDDDFQELRYNKWAREFEMRQMRLTEQLRRRYSIYFFTNGSCRAHDWRGCRECTQYANGRCPSYWEEKY